MEHMMKIKQKIKSLIKRVIWLFKEKEMIPISQPVNASAVLKGKTA